MRQNVPNIHLDAYRSADPKERQELIQTLGDGLCQFGFLTVSGHGVDTTLFTKAYEVFRRFFAMPEHIKNKYDCSQDNTRGFTPFGREHAKDHPYPDLKEFWQIGQELPSEDPESSLFPPNIWPSELPEMREVLLPLFRSLENCAALLLEAFAAYFDLSQQTFTSMIQRGDSVLRAIYYPPLPAHVEAKQIRAAAHEDINVMTLLPQSDGAGLEILTREGEWLPVNAPANDLIVDTGDMMARITNGMVSATTHRVVNPPHVENAARFSMPFFVHPHPQCELRVISRFVTPQQPAKYPPITARAFLEERLQQIGLRHNASSPSSSTP